ncbi:hypothetical protein [Vibrio phage pTD1]|uniref:Uncharacterized protein n=1 Tax=Vibrio phage pTD1 TaxID=1938577 RepID=A0A1Q2U332_9CAUD|nr:hypothetical protein FDH33_gp180 [Vibrio phage pTD1]BAW98389.1 hypothetical protein [Vibrio phage pTD1]
MILTCLLMTLAGFLLLVGPYDHNMYSILLMVCGIFGTLLMGYQDVHFGKRYHVTVTYPSQGVCFRIHDRHFNTCYEFEVITTPDFGTEILADHQSLNRVIFRAQTGLCDFANLEMCLDSLPEADRTTASDNVFNLVKLIKQQSPVIRNTHLKDYAFSSRAKTQFARRLQQVV